MQQRVGSTGAVQVRADGDVLAHGQAGEGLRDLEGAANACGADTLRRQADEARAKADLAQAEAERAQEQATTAEQAHAVDQAGYEDKVRVADQVDPDVNTESADYEPDAWTRNETDPDGAK